ncbi:HAD family hydrolase [Wenxinia saemankumensis]|uniref:2-haloacid dehalogenase n=1 Tax=Wenxinia saemankumensis TaxID=1447782 RepID=A0A1M6FIM8_9RHOB|nr:HAD family phosphatase [Wenxinia saemankumensis]SHI97499.1 2-haloacid dehalogenase [Wenxinia saemankumensis]
METTGTAPKAAIFDIGNVLIEWNPQRMYDRHIGAERRAALFEAVDLHGMNLAVDGGAPFGESVEALAARHPDWAAEIRLWRDNWLEMVTPGIEESQRLMAALQARGVPVHALTNFGDETFAIAEREMPFIPRFDSAFVSGRLRMLKPAPAIYAHVEETLGLSGPELFFTDDSPANVAAAEARGWRTHLFEGAEGLAARLVEVGLLDEVPA